MISQLRALKSFATDSADRLRRGGLYHGAGKEAGIERHIKEAADWLKRAQDAGTNRGVSWGVNFGGPFLESYPETTGYIIPTFLQLADVYHDDDYRRRAIEMGDWESDIQMPTGAVMGGRYNTNPTPAVFNTGMVLLGWAALYEREKTPRHLESLQRASRWLIDIQEPSGTWIQGHSKFVDAKGATYNVKAAWGLAEAGKAGNMPEAIAAAARNAEWCLSQQLPNGWYRECCLSDAKLPLLHTIAYSMQGLLGIAAITGRQDFVAGAQRTADSLINLMDAEGFIPGRIDSNFRGAVDWCCLTGVAQTAICWGKLFKLTGDQRYRDSMHRANAYLMRHQDIDNDDPGLRGGIPGSYPAWGEYGRLAILNWATNFFVESLLLQKAIG